METTAPAGLTLAPRSAAAPLAGLLLLLGRLVCLDLAIGPSSLGLSELADALWADATEPAAVILRDIRLPRAATAVLAGAAIGVAGLLMQTLFANPLADPWALGLTAGAQFGVAMTVAAGAVVGFDLLQHLGWLNQLGVIGGALLGCTLVLAVIAAVARRVAPTTLLIVGLMLGYLAQGLVSVVLHFTSRTQGRVFDAWNDGTFANVTVSHLQVLGPVLALALAGALSLAKPLDGLMLGDRYAASIGLAVPTVRRLVLTATLGLTAPVTAYCGPIAFLGLVAPHLARLLFGSASHRWLVPVSATIGACLAVGGDLIVHLPWERHFLHLNAINGLLGAPLVIWLLLRQRAERPWS